MKSNYRSHLVVILLLVSTLCLVSCSGDKKMEKQVYLPAGEVHEGWYFAGGERVVILGTVNGDAYVAGGTVQIDGTINGDLLAAGGQVIVSGTVTNNIRATGGTIRIDGNVGRDVTAAGGTIAIGKASSVAGNLLAAGGDITITGNVGKEARLAASQLTVFGVVQGPVTFAGQKLDIASGARIQGNLNMAVKDTGEIRIAPGAVQGTITRVIEEKPEKPRILGASPFALWFSIIWICSLLVTALVLVFLFPAQVVGTAAAVQHRPGVSALTGLVGLIAIPFAVLLLLVTLVAAPLALFVLFLFFFLLYLSQVALGVAVGDRIFHFEGKRTWRLFMPAAVGILIVQVLALIPFLGFFVVLVELILGFGALLYMVWKEYRKPSLQP
jgi:cytoskeletal protein CcmA (bactofilin family)